MPRYHADVEQQDKRISDSGICETLGDQFIRGTGSEHFHGPRALSSKGFGA